jgi:ribonuclease HI
MNIPSPHFLLFSESTRTADRGQWRFVLQSVDGADQIEASDSEPHVQGERLELLAVVRGLEALPQPSRVTLVTPSRYVNRGLSYGLAEWRTNDWQWEHFGEMAPIKNRDLWQRIDRALEFHSIDCRLWRFDCADAAVKGSDVPSPLAGPHYLRSKPESAKELKAVLTSVMPFRQYAGTGPVLTTVNGQSDQSNAQRAKTWWQRRRQRSIRRVAVKLLRLRDDYWESVCLRLRQFCTPFSLPPWLE